MSSTRTTFSVGASTTSRVLLVCAMAVIVEEVAFVEEEL